MNSNINCNNLNELLEANFSCDCNSMHKACHNKIIFESEEENSLPTLISTHFKQGRILIVTVEDIYTLIASPIIASLKAKGYKLVEYIYPTGFSPSLNAARELFLAPEDITMVLSVGGATVLEVTKLFSKQRGITHIAKMTSASFFGYASSFASLLVDGSKTAFPAKSPDYVVINCHELARAREDIIAASFGEIAANYLDVFDYKVDSIFNKTTYCDFIVKIALGAADDACKAAEQIANGNRLAGVELLVNAQLRHQLLPPFLSSPYGISRATSSAFSSYDILCKAQGYNMRMYGEEVFMFTTKLTMIYHLFFSTTLKKYGLPPDMERRQDIIVQKMRIKEEFAYKMTAESITPSKLKEMQLILLEEKADLFREIDILNAKMPKLVQLFENMYSQSVDRWLSNVRTSRIKLALLLSTEILPKRFTTLTILKELGLLEGYFE